MEDIRGQQLAYNTHLDTIRTDHERALALENDKQAIENQSNLGEIRSIQRLNNFALISRAITERFKSHAPE